MIRTSIVIVAIVFAAQATAHAQSDRVLATINSKLPTGWQLVTHNKRVVISRAALVWSLHGNRINAMPFRGTAAQHKARIMRHGKRVKARLEFRAVRRWSKADYTRAKRANRRTAKRLSALEKKYNLRQRRTRRRKGRMGYQATTAAERANLAAYFKERGILRAQQVTLPTCNTSRRSLFLVKTVGETDNFHVVHPAIASQQVHKVRELMRAMCHPPR